MGVRDQAVGDLDPLVVGAPREVAQAVAVRPGPIGLTFQQVQKYEKGVNRVSAGRLYEMARVLGVTISYFYEGIDELLETLPTPKVNDPSMPASLPIFDQETTELIIEFQKIKDASLRRSLLETIRAAAASFDS